MSVRFDSADCPEKFRLHARGDNGSLLYTIDKKGKRIPRLTNTYCRLRCFGRCMKSKCPKRSEQKEGGSR